MTDQPAADADLNDLSAERDRGPLRTYEITWTTGHVERVQGHQVMIPFSSNFGGMFGHDSRTTKRVMIHGEFDGHWRLVLAAKEHLIAMVRDVTDGEQFADVIA